MVVSEKKKAYFIKMKELVLAYKSVLICGVDNVGSLQLQNIRADLREDGVILMGKNTMMRKCLREMLEDRPELEALIDCIQGNVGLLFTNGDVAGLRDKIKKHNVPAAAKAGAISQCDVVIPSGPTGMDPNQTSFLQALNIATKIVKGQIEILNPVHLLHVGDKVNSSHAALLQKLGQKPFIYGLVLQRIFEDGNAYDPSILDITTSDILAVVGSCLSNIAAVSLEVDFPSLPAVPHAFRNGLKNVMAVSIATDYTYKQIEELKNLLNDPEALAKAAAAAAPTSAAAAAEAPAAAAAPEPEEESDEEMGFGLFD